MKKRERYNDYYEDDEDRRLLTKKKIREERLRKQQRNLKNDFRSKSFDPARYSDEDDDG